jgi:hypothetical protein
MLPNGGFPPIKLCSEDSDPVKKKENKENKEKGFFYSTKTNNINIREILKKSKNKVITDVRQEEELDILDSL